MNTISLFRKKIWRRSRRYIFYIVIFDKRVEIFFFYIEGDFIISLPYNLIYNSIHLIPKLTNFFMYLILFTILRLVFLTTIIFHDVLSSNVLRFSGIAVSTHPSPVTLRLYGLNKTFLHYKFVKYEYVGGGKGEMLFERAKKG